MNKDKDLLVKIIDMTSLILFVIVFGYCLNVITYGKLYDYLSIHDYLISKDLDRIKSNSSYTKSNKKYNLFNDFAMQAAYVTYRNGVILGIIHLDDIKMNLLVDTNDMIIDSKIIPHGSHKLSEVTLNKTPLEKVYDAYLGYLLPRYNIRTYASGILYHMSKVDVPNKIGGIVIGVTTFNSRLYSLYLGYVEDYEADYLMYIFFKRDGTIYSVSSLKSLTELPWDGYTLAKLGEVSSNHVIDIVSFIKLFKQMRR